MKGMIARLPAPDDLHPSSAALGVVANAGESLREAPNVMEILHAAVSAAESHHGLNLLGDGRDARIRSYPRSRNTVDEGGRSDFIRFGDNGIADAEIHLYADPRPANPLPPSSCRAGEP